MTQRINESELTLAPRSAHIGLSIFDYRIYKRAFFRMLRIISMCSFAL